MNLITILLIGCGLLISFEGTYSRGEKLKLSFVKGITEVPSNEIPNFEKLTVADTEPKRLTLCQDGLELVKSENREKKVEFFERTPIEPLKAYVLIGEDNVVQVIWGFKCPMSPVTYIRLCLDNTAHVISKITRPIPTPKKIIAYLIRPAIDISLANAERIAAATPASIASSHQYDSDEMEEDQRLQMCKKAMQPAVEMGVRLVDNKPTGISKYYVVLIKSDIEGIPFREDYMQLFDCPTEPKMYIYVYASEDGNSLWAIIREDEIDDRRPAFNIMGYLISSAVSISPREDFVSSRKNVSNEEMLAKDDDPMDVDDIKTHQLSEIQAQIKNKAGMSEDELAAMLQRLQPLLDTFNDATNVQKEMLRVIMSELVSEEDKSVIDGLEEEECRKLCETAIKIVSGRDDVELTADTIGPTQYYTIEEEEKLLDSDSDGSTLTIISKAFKCPTRPVVYIRIIKDSSVGNVVCVIVESRGDLEHLTAKFKK